MKQQLKHPLVYLCLAAIVALAPSAAAVPADTIIERARELYHAGRYAEAQVLLEQAVAEDSESFDAWFMLGMSLYHQVSDDDALDAFQHTIKIDRKRPDGHLGAGLVLLRKPRRRLDAREYLLRAGKLAPKNAEIQYQLGLSYIGTNSLTESLGYGAFKDGQKYLKRAIDLDPDHPDAYYQLAKSYEFPGREYEKAILFYFRQIIVKPDHPDALAHLGSCSLITGRTAEGLAMVNELADTIGETNVPGIARIRTQMEASEALAAKDYKASLTAYEAYLAELGPKERNLYTNLRFLTQSGRETILTFPSDSGKEGTWRRFWASRDPDPFTETNERLVEHYRRVMYARTHFARGKYPWDRRGDIYVRYGKPTDRQSIFFADGNAPPFPSGNNKVDIIRATNPYRLRVSTGGLSTGSGLPFRTESWVYVPYGIELLFVDQMGREDYDYPLGAGFGNQATIGPRNTVARLIEQIPDDYQYDHGGEPIQLVLDVVTFKDSDSGTLLEMAFSIPRNQLGHAGDGRGMTTWLEGSMVVRDTSFQRIASLDQEMGPLERPLSLKPRGITEQLLNTSQISTSVPPGVYQSALAVRDRATQRIGMYEIPVAAADYSSDSLQVSGIRLASSIVPSSQPGTFDRHGLRVVPHPTRAYDREQDVFFYYEIYNLKPDESGTAHFRTQLEITAIEAQRGFFGSIVAGIGKLGNIVRGNDEDPSVVLVSEDEASETDAYRYRSIEIGESGTGPYTLTLTITDLTTTAQASRKVDFLVVEKEEN